MTVRRVTAISGFLQRLHPRLAETPWSEISTMTEAVAARTLGRSSILFRLGRFGSVGQMPLEARASECVCAGFTAIGGWEYATVDNAFWVPDDDIAAADALARAADLLATGGPALRAMQDAARETAARWFYRMFLAALEETWMGLAPQARIHSPRGAA